MIFIHGFYVVGHAINLEVIPGQVARGTVTFMQPGEFDIVCNQYCGAGHQVMYGSIVVQ